MSPSQSGLFTEPSIGPWLSDEIVFSLASRHHRLSGNHSHETTCLQLFGHRQLGCAHDFPSRIDELARRADGALGDPATIIREHTILPYFLPFRSRDAANSAIAALRGPSIGSLKYQLGLLTSRFRAHHPLKACAQCMSDDRAHWGVSFWHRSHQLPGCWICAAHSVRLLECTLKSTGVGRFSWVLPSEDNLRLATSEAVTTTENDEALLCLGHSAEAICTLPENFSFDPARLVRCYLSALQDRDLARPSGRFKAAQIGTSYLSFAATFRGIPEFATLPTSAADALTQVRRLLDEPRSGTHPLRHLLVIGWLFGSWEDFWSRYQQFDAKQAGRSSEAPTSSRKERLSEERMLVVNLVTLGRRSVSSAAREAGVDTATAMAWMAESGHASPRRPKVLRGPVRRRLIGQLRAGKSAPAIATSFGMSVSTVNRVLRTEVGLRTAWLDARSRAAKRRARDEWSACLRRNPNLRVKHLRMIAPAAYAWLYRNDSSWLSESTGRLTRKSPRAIKRVSWDSRDADLAALVQNAALELSRPGSGKKLAIWQIYQRLPELKPKLRYLERLPLTRAALQVATAGPAESSLGLLADDPRDF